MSKHRPSVLLALTLLAPACQSQGGPTELPDLPSDAVAVQFANLDEISSVIGGPAAPARTVIRDEQAWLDFWYAMKSMIVPAPEPPTIDFSQEMVVVAAMGRHPTGGFEISIEGVYESGGELFVDVLERSPGWDCITAQVITAPVTGVRVPARPGAVQFMERQSSESCS
jgi:hypothetical protein